MFAALKLGLFYRVVTVRGASHSGTMHFDVREARDVLGALLAELRLGAAQS